MSREKDVILFIGHNATRSGAPTLLLDLIREFKKHSDLPFIILLRRGGSLVEDFKLLGNTMVWQEPYLMPTGNAIRRRLHKILFDRRQASRQRKIVQQLQHVRLILLNTVVSGDLLPTLVHLKCPVITYAHEMEIAIREATTAGTMETLKQHTTLFLAPSNAVRANLIQRHQIASDQIQVIDTHLQIVEREKQLYHQDILAFKQGHGIPKEAKVVGIIAANEWRKGFDLLFPLARLYVSRFGHNLHFVWIGVTNKYPNHQRVLDDLDRFGLGQTVHLVSHSAEIYKLMAALDIHLLLAREDPYPLVVLEAATFGIPTICFDNAGGAPEFVEHDSGYCVPYGDLMEVAEKLHQLVGDPVLLKRMGKRAKDKVKERHSKPKAVEQLMVMLQKKAF